jgi:hypothetical protein
MAKVHEVFQFHQCLVKKQKTKGTPLVSTPRDSDSFSLKEA